MSMKNPMTPLGIEPATFRLVVQICTAVRISNILVHHMFQ
jgi:hypothetical protein